MSDTRPVPVIEQPPAVSRRQRYIRKFRLTYNKSAVFVIAHRSLRLMTLQIVGALTVLVGIAQYSVPIALIIGGAGAILAVERQ